MNMRPEYVMRLVEINKNNIKNLFYIYEEERRKLKITTIKNITKQFDRNNKLERHFSSPFVVNEENNKYNLIDGNHRYEAIKEKINKEEDFNIFVWCAVYKDLTRDEELIVYKMWNGGAKESATDFLKLHWEKVPLRDLILKELPVSIYISENKLAVKTLIGSYFSAKQDVFRGGYGANGPKMVEDFIELTHEDIKIIKAFYKDYSEAFGEVAKGNKWYCTTPITVLFRIWYDNKNSISRDKMVKEFKNCFFDNTISYIKTIEAGGRKACENFYGGALLNLNNRRKAVWK